MFLLIQKYKYTPQYEYISSMHWIVLFTCILIGFTIIFQVFYICYSNQKPSKEKLRYLYLAILFLLYNVFNGLLPNTSLPGPLILQYVITYGISIFMCIYLIWYLYNEFNIITPNYFFQVKNLTVILSVSFLLLFIVPYFFSYSLNSSRSLFLILPILLSSIFFIYFLKVITKEVKRQRYFKIQTYLGLCSILSIVLLPLLTFFGDFQPITQPVVSAAFFLVTTMEINSYLYRLKNTHTLKLNVGRQYNFTNRENEIALQIIKKNSYKQIAQNMFIAYGTVRKHASNIYIKSNCASRKDFIKKFKK
ncbi:DNA-binding response regulator [Algibacter lectus]|uniref:DNA-binding response regulator n=1 Tax=Algibacter lectus TaxID=221126 RepID=A0A090VG22_9FLAO|nr:DNA-binding response regulator [Algibacter lectus]SFB89786.1 regulatory protein, luxR family [Algibacter lectus]